MVTLLRNSMLTPDGTHLISKHRHEYVTYEDENGEHYFVDGGDSYIRRSINKHPAKDTSLYSDDPHELLREELVWGSYGREPDYHELEYIKIKDLNTLHIHAILDGAYGSEAYRQVMRDELEWRVHGGSPIEAADKQRKSEEELTILGEKVVYDG